ncbi:FAD dependent oxidoreductase superfamily protein [Amylocarpus encephaloides]|uniref:FAD dependent oxidoreductase superfamily protein n=1 Tax=Amylocarpus encephaloides TaxID=45428 RepID=A0A9P7YIJ8_9HELO|nr:FAD dependent oxidoreductase superfamily protein [Amylocarpus encephaloides]
MTASKYATGLPVPDPTKSYWQTPPHKIADLRSTLKIPEKINYVIVGSGITGASIAYKLLVGEPSASIVMLEARQAASGASGRNGGHCRAGRYVYFKAYLEKFGKDDALLMEQLEEANVKNVGAFIKEQNIDCDLRDVETIDISTDQRQWESVLAALKARQEVFDGKREEAVLTKHKLWSAQEAKEDLLVPNGVGAVSFPAFALQPYKFVCALLEMSMERGLNLQTNTPVLEVSPIFAGGAKKWQVMTERGDVLADKVILATNAYTGALYPPLSNFIIPTRGQIAAIRPGSKIDGNPVLERTGGLADKEYWQRRAKGLSGEGDIIFGGGRRKGPHGQQPMLDDSRIDPTISAYLSQETPSKYFGENWGENGLVVQEWSGIMGYTFDTQPIIGEAPGQEGLWICAGFHGHGMAMTFQSAEALVQLLLGKQEVLEWLPNCFKIARLPMEK